MKIIIAAIAGDPGGARAILPVMAMFQQNQREIIIYAYNEAIAIFKDAGLQPTELCSLINESDILKLLQNNKINFLLTATSHNGVDLEKHFIQAANRLQIYSLSILDFWSNYSLRFRDKHGKLAYLPNKIAVMDQTAKKAMIEEGIPELHILVSGHPAFEFLKQYRQIKKITMKKEIYAQWNIAEQSLLVIFISQPLREMYGDATKDSTLGYDECSTLLAVISGLEEISKRLPIPITLIIRPHPREKLEQYSIYTSKQIKVITTQEGDSRHYLIAADLVVGMTSILLIEACYLQCIVLSVQLGLKVKDVLPTNELGISLLIKKKEFLPSVLETYLLNRDTRETLREKTRHLVLDEDASKKIVNHVETYFYSQDAKYASN